MAGANKKMIAVLLAIALCGEGKYNHWSKGGKRPPPFLDLALGP